MTSTTTVYMYSCLTFSFQSFWTQLWYFTKQREAGPSSFCRLAPIPSKLNWRTKKSVVIRRLENVKDYSWRSEHRAKKMWSDSKIGRNFKEFEKAVGFYERKWRWTPPPPTSPNLQLMTASCISSCRLWLIFLHPMDLGENQYQHSKDRLYRSVLIEWSKFPCRRSIG